MADNDKYDELHPAPDDDDGIPVDYNPFHEEAIEALLERAAIAIEKQTRAWTSGVDRLCAAFNKQAKAMDAQASAINARREVVRGDDGKIIATKVVH
jgi:hypothetical protein